MNLTIINAGNAQTEYVRQAIRASDEHEWQETRGEEGNLVGIEGLVLCCASPFKKAALFDRLFARGGHGEYPQIIHPAAIVDLIGGIGMGTIINPLTTIQPKAAIGRFCMIHSHIEIGHDTKIGDFCNLSPGVIINGGCEIGKYVQIFSRAVMFNNIKVGEGAIIGMGAVVTQDVPAWEIWQGSPAEKVGLTHKPEGWEG